MTEFDKALNKIAPFLEGVENAHLRATQIVSALSGRDHLIDEQGRHSLDCWCYDEPFEFQEKPAAKSSTSAMVSSVCQKCGHKLDGKKRSKVNPIMGGAGEPCRCKCHEGA